MTHRIVTFGEIMLRLSPPGNLRFAQTSTFDATFGGGESNVAVSLAHLGLEVSFVTKVPDNPLGRAAVNFVRQFGVKTDHVVLGGDRLGIYFLECGSAQRPSKVVYDRAGSAVSGALLEDFAWEEIFEGASWFHWTGITPAVSDRAAACVKRACVTAKQKGVTVSCDLNYRKKLWSREKAREVMTDLMQYVDVCFGNEEDAYDVFSIRPADSDVTKGKLNHEGYESVARQLMERFGFRTVAVTLRESFSASHNGWSAMLYDGKTYYRSKRYDIRPIVDRVGGGDAFGAGLIYGLVNGRAPQETVDFAVAASCLKHTIAGDFNLATAEEVELLAGGDASGRVQR